MTILVVILKLPHHENLGIERIIFKKKKHDCVIQSPCFKIS